MWRRSYPGSRHLSNNTKCKSLTDWKPVKERIITAYFQTSPVKITMIQADDPTMGDDNNNKDGF